MAKNEFDYLNDVKMDFSVYENGSISEEEIRRMRKNAVNKRRKLKVVYSLAACVAIVAVAGTAFASGYLDNVIKTLSTGHNQFIQTDASAPDELPDELKGKIFDENGNAVEYLYKEDIGNIYDENGERINDVNLVSMYEEATDGSVEVYSVTDDGDAEAFTQNYATIDEAQAEAEFDIKTPEYLPEGYSLSRTYAYENEDGSVSGKYRNIEYKNEDGDEIIVMERLIDDTTAYTYSTDGTVEETTINGRTAAITDGNCIDWETEDGVSVSINGGHSLSVDELIKIAESVK